MTNHDTYNSRKECQDSKYNRKQTNDRYPHFKQHHYTVGDEEQFDSIVSSLPEMTASPTIETDKLNIFLYPQTFWEGYRQQERINVIQTFRYIFYKFKKGIYIRIHQNKLQKFIPFSNANFINEWSEQLDIDYSIFKKVNELENRPFDQKNINKFVQNWFCNNSLLRYEYPINESDTNTSNIKNFFDELCLHRRLPDIEFFVNKRDFPLLTTTATEPYFDIWGHDKPLVSHKYDFYLPILSMSKTTGYADILIPTHEDWARVQQKENKWFIDSRVTNNNIIVNHDFKQKKAIAVFRGSSTGDGFTIESNQRLHISYLSSQNKIDENDKLPYLDCGITKWNTRPKKLATSKHIQMIDPTQLPFTLVKFLTLSQQSQYKYIVHIDGHVSAFRLSAMMSLNCVPLIVKSKWTLWYSHLLIPYEHFIPIKEDLSNLYEQIQWCKENDDACEMIAFNAREFAEKYLEKDGMFDYTQKILTDLKCFMRYTPSFPVCSLPHYPTLPLPNTINTILNSSTTPIKVFENRNVIVTRVDSIVIKERKHTLRCSNNIIDFLSPNFSRVYGYTDKNHVIMEYIDGIKLYDFIADKTLFDFQVYLDVLLQISLSLHVAQKEVLFVHNDLTPWNIILKRSEKPVHLTYDEGTYHISTRVVPMIIDYDKSHVIDTEYIHHGSVNSYKFSSIQDILSLLFTSLFQIISNHKLNYAELKAVLTLANFISNTTFYPRSFKSIHQLKAFLFSMKKHSALIYTDKLDLEHLSPLDFVAYLRKHNFRIPSLPQTPLVSSYDASFEFDKYIFWSPSKTLSLRRVIQSSDLKTMFDEAKRGNIRMKRNLSNIVTFNSLYK
jgi:hypothetical protein